MTKEALKLAMEALEDLGMKHFENTGEVLYKETFTAIKEALMSVPDGAQPSVSVEQEPVALEAVYETIIEWDESGGKRSRRELARRIVSLYTTPPQRKPLTDEEIHQLDPFPHIMFDQQRIDFARAIEAAHGIKGEA